MAEDDVKIPLENWKQKETRKAKKDYVGKEMFKKRHEESIENTKRWREKHSTGPNWWMLTPLAFAPILPLIRIGFRHNPVLRDRLFKWTLGAGVTHGIMLISGIYSDED